METEQSLRQSRPIVAFDFDGTLTIQDSYTRFLRWRAGELGYAAGLVRLIPDMVGYAIAPDRGRLKAAATKVFLGGADVETVSAEAKRFAEEIWDQFMRPDALACWREWGRKGAERVIVTASPALTVRPFAERLGADRLLGTELEVDASGLLTGAFATANCRAGEKVLRLKQAFGDPVRLVAAYGDTSGDTEMLAVAEHRGWREFTQRP